MSREEAVRRILEDKYCRRILDTAFDRARTLNFLSMKFDLPAAVCHRIVLGLIGSGLMSMDRKVMTGQGKWVQLYRSNIRTDPEDPGKFVARIGDGTRTESFSHDEVRRFQEVLT